VVVHDLHIFSVGARPAKADAKLVVDADAPLTRTIALQLLEPVPRWRTQIVDATRQVELLQLAQGRALDVRESRHPMQPEQRLGVHAMERDDRHTRNSNVARY
jgi:hypothetical protein